jgi:tetratricopeptide (TPR) repeat protein
VVGEDAPVFFYYLAGALQLDGRTQHALKAAREALAMKSDVPEFAQRSAWILYHAGRHAEAEQAYLDWLRVYDDNYDALGIRETVRDARFILSSICGSDQRPDQAVEWLEQVLDEFPGDVGAMNDLGYLLADQGLQLQRALGMIQNAVACEPENFAYRDSLGWALYRLGRYDEAVEELSLAAKTEQPDPVILDHLADAQMAVGNRADAIRLWRRVLGLLEDKDGHHQRLRMRVQGKLQEKTAESH